MATVCLGIMAQVSGKFPTREGRKKNLSGSGAVLYNMTAYDFGRACPGLGLFKSPISCGEGYARLPVRTFVEPAWRFPNTYMYINRYVPKKKVDEDPAIG